MDAPAPLDGGAGESSFDKKQKEEGDDSSTPFHQGRTSPCATDQDSGVAVKASAALNENINAKGTSDMRKEVEINTTNTKAPDDNNPLPKGRATKRLSSAADRVDLEYSLGSLDSTPQPVKRKCFSFDPSYSAASSQGSRKKRISPVPPIKSLAEALKPKFWQESASVSVNNVPSTSFDVGEEEGGSSPLSTEEDDVPGHSNMKVDSVRPRRRLSLEEKRSIAEAEDVMKAAALAAQAETSHASAHDSSETGTGDSSAAKEVPNGKRDDEPGDFDAQMNGNSLGLDDYGMNSRDSNISAASFAESYSFSEEDYSMPLPPAPPSTPAASKDSFTPIPYSEVAKGKIAYLHELRGDELKGSKQDTKANLKDEVIPPPPPLDESEKSKLPDSDQKASSILPQKYNADFSGAATEPRRGGGAAANRKESNLKLRSKTSDFDQWAVGDRYKLKRILGRGSYGEVAQAIDLSRKKKGKNPKDGVGNESSGSASYVAVKKISKAFDQEVDAIRLYREMHILRRLDHICVIQLLDVVRPNSSDLRYFNDLYLVFEYVDTDLYKLIMSPQYLTTEHIQTFLYQMLVGVKYIHSCSVIHRDLKPAILLNEDCTLKICDFGLARIVHDTKISPTNTKRHSFGPDPQDAPQATVQDVTDEASNITGIPRHSLARQLTKHVVTRWYRAPELILIQPYASAVDIWSLGCIFAELLSMQEGSVPTYQDRVPIFPGGSCYPLSGDHLSSLASDNSDERLDQLSVIFSVIGMPPEEDLKSIGKANEYINSLEKKPGRSLESLYPAADPAAINLLKNMLMFNPAKRCTAEEALEHEFLKPVRRKGMEVCAAGPLEIPQFLERSKIDLATLKEEAYKEVLCYSEHSD